MPKKIVICCDGTGNRINDHHSNVLKLYRILRKSKQQTVYYDPGVGTLGARNEWDQFKQNSEKVAGLALGYGLDRNVLDAYRFLVRHYVAGDEIFMFGFSRGAYTVRVIAGFINTIGLLNQQQLNLCDYALVAYKQISEGDGFDGVRKFEQVLRPKRPPIKFLGLWDTVSSVIVPRRDRMYLPSFRQLAYTAYNPSVEIVRHALAIDERRRMFRPYLWKEGKEYWGGPFPSNNPTPQDVQQVWFAGVHSDIGGGYREEHSGLAKIVLQWMYDETKTDLNYVTQSVNQIILGKNRKNSKQKYVAADPTAKLGVSLTNGWKIFEWLPKRTKFQQWSERRSLLGFYLPNGEPRIIDKNASIHASVATRKKSVIDYQPVNVP